MAPEFLFDTYVTWARSSSLSLPNQTSSSIPKPRIPANTAITRNGISCTPTTPQSRSHPSSSVRPNIILFSSVQGWKLSLFFKIMMIKVIIWWFYPFFSPTENWTNCCLCYRRIRTRNKKFPTKRPIYFTTSAKWLVGEGNVRTLNNILHFWLTLIYTLQSAFPALPSHREYYPYRTIIIKPADWRTRLGDISAT